MRPTCSRLFHRLGLAAPTSALLRTSSTGPTSTTPPSSSGAAGGASEKDSSSSSSSTGGGLFHALRKKLEEFELQRDRAMDETMREMEQEERALGTRGDRLFGKTAASSKSSSAAPKRVSEDPTMCPRSVLFVPGSKPRAMQKIYALHADCYVLDLEDSVGPTHKREAREHVRIFAEEVHAKVTAGTAPYRRLYVRINSPDDDPENAMLDLELVGALGRYIEGVAIPKVGVATYDLIKDYVHPEHRLWAFFETPKAVADALHICKQGVYECAVMGYNDLAAELELPLTTTAGDVTGTLYAGLPETEVAALRLVSRLPLWQSASHVLLCARACGMFAVDGVFNNPTDSAGFLRDLRSCVALGFNGKSLIHPSQIAPTNEAYVPSEATVQWAGRVQEAVARAQGSVVTVDGNMVEELHVRQASRVLRLHRSEQLEAGDRAAAEAAAEGKKRTPPSRQGEIQ